MWVNPLVEAGHYLDMINIMSYDAGPYVLYDTREKWDAVYNPVEAYKAYRNIYKGVLNIGIESPPEAWGGNIVKEGDIKAMANAVTANNNDKDGLFIWSLQKWASGGMKTKSIMETMCKDLGFKNCTGAQGELPK